MKSFRVSFCAQLLYTFHSTDIAAAQPSDPQGNIACLGEKYAIDLPVLRGFNPNQVTMQQLCAKTQYNGGQPGQHAGGWCAPVFSSYYRGVRRRVVFDQSAAAQTNPELSHPRVLLGCLFRCYCSPGTTDLTIQPVDTDRDLARHYQHSSATYEIKIDVVDDFDVPLEQHMGILQSQWVESLPIIIRTQGEGPSPVPILTSMDEQNSIYCRGPLPSFPLPSPFQASDFSNIQALCATMFHGGHLYVDHFRNTMGSSTLTLTLS